MKPLDFPQLIYIYKEDDEDDYFSAEESAEKIARYEDVPQLIAVYELKKVGKLSIEVK